MWSYKSYNFNNYNVKNAVVMSVYIKNEQMLKHVYDLFLSFLLENIYLHFL